MISPVISNELTFTLRHIKKALIPKQKQYKHILSTKTKMKILLAVVMIKIKYYFDSYSIGYLSYQKSVLLYQPQW